MARDGLLKRQLKLEKKLEKQLTSSTNKFGLFDALNKTLDTKLDKSLQGDARTAAALKIEADRASARRRKATIVAQQSYATTDEPGAGSAKGMFFADGERGREVRGKEKIKKGPQAPRFSGKKGSYGKDVER